MKIKIISIITFISLNSYAAKDIRSITCKDSDKLNILYVNSSHTDETKSEKERDHIKKLVDEKSGIASINSNDICYKVIYNKTSGALEDYIEIVGQLINESNSQYGTQFDESEISRVLFAEKTFVEVDFLSLNMLYFDTKE